jgi:hypothetical protein
MSRIYRRAKRVNIWLGDEADDSGLAIAEQFMEGLASSDVLDSAVYDRKAYAMRKLFERPWWTACGSFKKWCWLRI